MHVRHNIALTVATAALFAGCGAEPTPSPELTGEAEVALTNKPADVSCLRITVQGTRRDVRSFNLTGKAVFRLTGLPVGNDTFSAEAFQASCANVTSTAIPTWLSEPVTERVRAGIVTHVALNMIHNGQGSVSVNFDEENAPTPEEEPELTGGIHTAKPPYLVAIAGTNITVKPILSVGDSPNNKPDGTPYRMVGIPDGTGTYDNGDGTFTLLSNQELGPTAGVPRAHGGKGAFVSKWTIRKADFAVLKGEDLIKQVYLWNGTQYVLTPNTTFGRFCSANLPERSALFDAESGLGFDGELFFDGEETGDEGRGVVHALDGTSWDLPRAGKFSWENAVPAPAPGKLTIVAGLDDTSPSANSHGEVYFYVGEKTNSGTPIDKAGLTNGKLYGLKVSGQANEAVATGLANGPFELHNFGDVSSWTGAKLSQESIANQVTGFNRPEDGSWDPSNPNHFYFVTTASFSNPSRLWVVKFADIKQPQLGGEIEMLLDGTEGQRMLDNMTLDQYGHVYLQEDPGGNDHIAKVWRYDIASDTLTLILQHNPDLFTPGAPNFITNDEESTGITDASDVLAPGWFLLNVQSHKNLTSTDPELVEDGQLLAFFDPASAG